jgi:hypothetical protein
MIIIKIQEYNVKDNDEFEAAYMSSYLTNDDLIKEHIITDVTPEMINKLMEICKTELHCSNCMLFPCDKKSNMIQDEICNNFEYKKI